MRKKLFSLLLVIFTLLVSNATVFAQDLGDATDATPMVILHCPINGVQHISSSKQFAKTKIDGESYSNFTRHACDCGAQVFIDGYPLQGFVGRYYYSYYKIGLEDFGTGFPMNVYLVRSNAVYSNYSSGELLKWRFY